MNRVPSLNKTHRIDDGGKPNAVEAPTSIRDLVLNKVWLFEKVVMALFIGLALTTVSLWMNSQAAERSTASDREFSRSQLEIEQKMEDLRFIRQQSVNPSGVQDASFSGMNLNGLALTHLKLIGADFRHSNLAGSGLSWSDITDAAFIEADLSKAIAYEVIGDNADLAASTAEEFRADFSSFKGANFTGSNLNGASFWNADLEDATFAEGSQTPMTLMLPDEQGALRATRHTLDTPAATLKNVFFEAANLKGANFRGTNLEGVSFQNADLRDAMFEGADLSHANLAGAKLAGICYSRETSWPKSFVPPPLMPTCEE